MIECCVFVSWASLTSEQQATWVIAVATVAYVVITLLLWKATKAGIRATLKSVDATRENIEVSKNLFSKLNSPYMGIEGATIKIHTAPFARTELVINFRNYGKVPANGVRLLGRWGQDLASIKEGVLPLILPATTAFPDALMHMPDPIPMREYVQIVDQRGNLFLRTELHFIDLDKEDQVHYYLGKYNHDHQNFQVLESWVGKSKECPYTVSNEAVEKSKP